MVDTIRALRSGDLIAGKYSIEEQLGHGGMGAVYSARHTGTGRRFAIKLLNPQLTGDAEAEARFLQEATLASAINHPAIVEVYDVGRHGRSPYMVMKLLEGESLGERLKRGPVPPEEAIAILLPVLDGVGAAHERGIVHRDLKPDNIMLQREGGSARPRVLDFGISKLLSADARTRLTKTGILLGTPLYMSPEQVRGERDIDPRSDVYALGVILYQMLTGVLPFEGNNYADLVLKIVEGGARGIRSLNPSLPQRLERVVNRAIAVSAGDRYASTALFAADLRELRSGVPPKLEARLSKPQAPTASTPFAADAPSRPPAAASRRRTRWLIAAFAAIALGSGLLWLLRPAPQTGAGARWPSSAPATAHEAPATPRQAAASAPTSAGSSAAASGTELVPPPQPPVVKPVSEIGDRTAGSNEALPVGPSKKQTQTQVPRTSVEKNAGPAEANQPRLPSGPGQGGADTPSRGRRRTEASPEPKPAPSPRRSRSLPSEIIDPFDQ